MSRRSHTNWSWLRWLIELTLSGQPGFATRVRLEDKLVACCDGIGHDNYSFFVGDNGFVLRLAKRWRPIRTAAESSKSLKGEAETLRALERCEFPFETPRFVCRVTDDAGKVIGLIEAALDGMPLKEVRSGWGRSNLESIGTVAAAVHALPVSEFGHVKSVPDSLAHVEAEMAKFPASFFDAWPVAVVARDWVLAHVTRRPAVFLHGDLLPQNLLWNYRDDTISVIDWEYAQIGDPAHDLAIVTRGARQPLKESGGLEKLLAVYEEKSGIRMPASAVHIHELLMHMGWLAEAARAQAARKLEGHAPEYYAQGLAALLRRSDRSQDSSSSS